jgi:PAS domain S-box-containing protein
MSSRLLNYWKAIIKLGFTSNLDYGQRARLATLNAICAISIGTACLFALAFVLVGSYTALQGLLLIPIMALVLYLNSKQLYSYARVLMIFFLLFLLLALALGDRRTGTEFILIAVGCLSIFVFENLSSILTALLCTALCYAFYTWYDATYPFVPDESVPYLAAQIASVLVSAFVVIVQLLVFRSLTSTYSRKLEEVHKEVQLVNEELQASNEELRSQTEHLDLLVEQKSSELQAYIDAINISIYSVITKLDGTILKVNKPMIEVSGYIEQELIGQNLQILNSGYHTEVFFKEMINAVREGQKWRGEVKNKAKDGSFFWMDLMIIPIKIDGGTTDYFLNLALPITERKEAEERQSAASKVLESIAFRASHKVRAPITRMQGLVDLIDKNLIHQDELALVAAHLKFSIDEMDLATGELTQFVNSQYQNTTPTADK